MSVGKISGIKYLHNSSSEPTNITLLAVFSSNHPRITGHIVENIPGEFIIKQVPNRSG